MQSQPMSATVPNASADRLARFGRPAWAVVASFFERFGDLGSFCWRLAKAVATPPYEGRELLRQMDEIGAWSAPLVALAGAATGVVISLQTRDSLVRFGAQSMLPMVIIFSLLRESGPVMAALTSAATSNRSHPRSSPARARWAR